jgi:hypothetical protein
MSNSNRFRWDGLAAILAAVLFALGLPGSNEILPGVSHVAGHILFAAAGLCALVALQGFAARDTACSVRVGLIGFYVAGISSLLVLGGNIAEAVWEYQYEAATLVSMLGMLGTIVGMVLIGIASRRTRALPGWSALTLIIAPVTVFVIFVLGIAIFLSGENPPTTPVGNAPLIAFNYVLTVVYAVPWVAMGYALWTDKGETASQNQPARVGL